MEREKEEGGENKKQKNEQKKEELYDFLGRIFVFLPKDLTITITT